MTTQTAPNPFQLLREQQRAAEATIADLEQRRPELVLSASLGDAAASKELAQLERALADAHRQIERAGVATVEARRQQAALEAAAAAEAKEDARQQEADLLQQREQAYRVIVERTASLAAAIGDVLSIGAALNAAELATGANWTAVRHERETLVQTGNYILSTISNAGLQAMLPVWAGGAVEPLMNEEVMS